MLGPAVLRIGLPFSFHYAEVTVRPAPPVACRLSSLEGGGEQALGRSQSRGWHRIAM